MDPVNPLSNSEIDLDRQTQLVNHRPAKDKHATPSNRLHEADLYRIADEYRQAHPHVTKYTLVYACRDYLVSPWPYCYLVKKSLDSRMHPGLYNFPGGRFENIPLLEKISNEHGPAEVECVEESPVVCALRELQEETGLTGSFPLLSGLIAPPPLGAMTPQQYHDKYLFPYYPYLVYCFKVVILGSTTPGINQDNPDSPVAIRRVTGAFQWNDTVPNLPLLAALFNSHAQGWILQEPHAAPSHYQANIVFTTPTHRYHGYRTEYELSLNTDPDRTASGVELAPQTQSQPG